MVWSMIVGTRCANNLVGTMMSMMDWYDVDVDCWYDDVWNVDWE